MNNGEEAAALVKELILILRSTGVCSCRMNEGALRVDANISINRPGEPLGIRTEVKNIGSVRCIAGAVDYEIRRQIDLMENGGKVKNETRSWDASSNKTVAMRDKEVLQDYRFMPEPNLPPLRLNVTGDQTSDLINVEMIRQSLPELPWQTRSKLIEQQNLRAETASILVVSFVALSFQIAEFMYIDFDLRFLKSKSSLLQYFTETRKIEPAIPSKYVADFLINQFIGVCNKIEMSVDDWYVQMFILIDFIYFKSILTFDVFVLLLF